MCGNPTLVIGSVITMSCISFSRLWLWHSEVRLTSSTVQIFGCADKSQKRRTILSKSNRWRPC